MIYHVIVWFEIDQHEKPLDWFEIDQHEKPLEIATCATLKEAREAMREYCLYCDFCGFECRCEIIEEEESEEI